MEAKQCPKGHYYDSEKHASCPICASETTPVGGTMPLDSDTYDTVPPTEPFTGADIGGAYDDAALKKTEPISGVTSYMPPFEDDKGTMPYHEANLGFVPTVGWVICIRGPHKGKDFRLVAGYNKVGRSSEMAICLPDDEQITRNSHAILIYEPQSRKFLARGDNNLIYINGAPQYDTQELHAYDVIKLGASELLFVPLCCEKFSWD